LSDIRGKQRSAIRDQETTHQLPGGIWGGVWGGKNFSVRSIEEVFIAKAAMETLTSLRSE
jgi:hypothetical protein